MNDRFVVVTNCIAGRNLFHPTNRDDLSRARLSDVLTLVSVHAHQAADAFLRVFAWIVSIGTSLDRAAVNARERELAQVFVGHDFEDQSGKWGTGIRRTRLN